MRLSCSSINFIYPFFLLFLGNYPLIGRAPSPVFLTGDFYSLRKKVDDFNARGHLVFGIATGLLIIDTPTELLLVMVGSLLPDIDHQNSTFGKYFFLNRTKLFKHRGKCHTILGVLVLSVPFFLISGYTSYLFVLYGAIGHLVADRLYAILPKKRKFTLKLW